MDSVFAAVRALITSSVARIERAAFILAAANAMNPLPWVQKEGGQAGELRPPTKEEWAAHIVAHAEALRREVGRD